MPYKNPALDQFLRDAEGLDPGGCWPGALVTDFSPTRHELHVLARYYVNTFEAITLDCLMMGQAGIWEWWTEVAAMQRIKIIHEFLGTEEFDTAVRVARDYWNEEQNKATRSCEACGTRRPVWEHTCNYWDNISAATP